MKQYSDDTPLASVIESPRAAKALKEAGFSVVKDLDGANLAALGALHGVGDRTIEQIRELNAELPEAEAPSTVEEGPHPIHLMSPKGSFALHLVPGDRVGDRFGFRVVVPVFVEFAEGRAVLTAEKWFLRKYARDHNRVQEALMANEPWRQEAHAWLKARRSHGRDFFILSD